MPETEEQVARAAIAYLSRCAPAAWEITLALGEHLELVVAGPEFRYSLTFTRGTEDAPGLPALASFAGLRPVLDTVLADWRAYKLAKHQR